MFYKRANGSEKYKGNIDRTTFRFPGITFGHFGGYTALVSEKQSDQISPNNKSIVVDGHCQVCLKIAGEPYRQVGPSALFFVYLFSTAVLIGNEIERIETGH